MILGAPQWIAPVLALAVVALAGAVWSYRHPGASARVRLCAGLLKTAGVLALLACLLEPIIERVRAQPGANELVVLVDDSRSLTVRTAGTARPHGEQVRQLVADEAAWLVRAGQEFALQRFAFGRRLRPLGGAAELGFAEERSDLAAALARLGRRNGHRPIAGIVLFSDGSATDSFGDLDWDALPPVHAVALGDAARVDVAVRRVEASQTNFEESPVHVRADVASRGCEGRSIAVELSDEQGTVIEGVALGDDAPPLGSDPGGSHEDSVRFRLPSAAPGVAFYKVAVRSAVGPASGAADVREATDANNERWVTVDRGKGPYRVLYVSGRPNWEFKFLRRAVSADPELELVGLIRIAKREPKFTFRDSAGRRNSFWEGFDNRDEESAEQYDEPVLLRVGTRDEFELRNGFPTAAEDLFGYDAIVVDDVEASFFSRDQMALVEQFVAMRGGGFLALGGEQAFAQGGYEGTPLGELLPVYMDSLPEFQATHAYELELTREGWLEPWIRLRATEQLERARLQRMPGFRTLNRVGNVKPGGTVLIEARSPRGFSRPAFVTQRFGKGRSAALLVGDLWRWDLGRRDPEQSDLGTAWRQMLRWLVSDVPRFVELTVSSTEGDDAVELRATVRDEAFAAAYGARVEIEVRPPGEEEPFLLHPTPSAAEPGVWTCSFTPRAAGPYRARLRAWNADESTLGEDDSGWVSEPWAREFESLDPNREQLAEIARRSGGSLVAPGELSRLITQLAQGEVPISEHELDPLWHRWWVFVLALVCLSAEWGLRRFHGLP